MRFPSLFGLSRAAQTGPEFGTNTGRQGTFDPDDVARRQQAQSRLQALQQAYGDRLAFNFTGNTGLGKHDAKGYSKMLNARTEAANIQRLLRGRQALDTEYGGVLENKPTPTTVFAGNQTPSSLGGIYNTSGATVDELTETPVRKPVRSGRKR
jgi:hypothetical protein